MRFLPRRFDSYIATSAAATSCSIVRPSSGKVDEAHGDRGAHVAVGHAERQRGDVAAQLLAHHVATGGVGLGQEDDELVAAVACRGIGGADGLPDRVRDGLQQSVAPLVSEACR